MPLEPESNVAVCVPSVNEHRRRPSIRPPEQILFPIHLVSNTSSMCLWTLVIAPVASDQRSTLPSPHAKATFVPSGDGRARTIVYCVGTTEVGGSLRSHMRSSTPLAAT